ncbi:MAE_28990/MAE_18760 family HEPN-like nuclease [Flavobacterium sp. GCM10023249]|uniref:MAE_28990/MAE_18760 family HEPN-like nuclease n=1 Tax=unclassified Flavobacterium TaxID=196869 RepID=UPI0036094C07
MEAILRDFHLQLDDLKKLIEFYELEKKLLQDFENSNSVNDLILNEISQKLKDFRISKLTYNYNSIIISLYGSFERFIENCIISYIEEVNGIIEEYKKLPEVITKNHLLLSLSLINKIEQTKYNGPLRKEIIIKNLHTCINTIDNYQLNKEAFAQHTANFRIQVIDDNFKQTGVYELSKNILKNEDFKSYLVNSKGVAVESTDLSINENLQPINELAELRNFVAHGIENDIMDNQILLDYVEFFKYYSKSLIDVLNEDLLYKKVQNQGLKLGNITDVFKDGNIVCFHTNGYKISKGQRIIGVNSKNIKSSYIKSIRVNDEDKEFVDGENIEIGIEIGDNFKKNFDLYVLK